MGRRGIFKKFLLILSFAAFLNAGYWTASKAQQSPLVVTPAAACNAPCIFPGTFAAAIAATGISIMASIAAITATITAKFTTASEDFTQTISDKIGDVTDNLVDWIDTFWTHNLMKAMQLQANQIVAMSAAQSRDIALITNAANHVRDVLGNQERRIRSWREHNASGGGCVAATVSGGMTRSNVIRRAYSSAAPAAHVGRSSNSSENPSSVSPAADMKDRWETYKTRYCEKDFNNGASGCEEDQLFAGQDVDVAGVIFAHDTIDVTNPDTKQTVDDLVINIAEPFIKDAVPPTAVDSPSGQGAVLQGEAYKAKRQTIYDSLYYIVSRRVPGSNLKDYIAPLRDKAGIDPSLVSANPSYNEIMQVMMNERFRSDSGGQVESPENTDRERVVQQAFQVMQMNDQLDLMDRYALVLAAQVGEEIRKNKKTGSATSGAPVK